MTYIVLKAPLNSNQPTVLLNTQILQNVQTVINFSQSNTY